MARFTSPRAPSLAPHGAEDAAQTRVQGLAEGAAPSLAMLQRQVLLGQIPMHEFAAMAARL